MSISCSCGSGDGPGLSRLCCIRRPVDESGSDQRTAVHALEINHHNYQHPRSNGLVDQSFITAQAAADASYTLDPLVGANHQVFHGAHGNVAPAPSYQWTVDITVANCGNGFSPVSLGATLCPSATGQHSSEPSPMQVGDSAPRAVGSDAMCIMSNKRRTKDYRYFCHLRGCPATFTARHNLNYHKNAHNGERPYKCLYQYLGCDYPGAAAPRTAKRHSLTCRYRTNKHA